MDIVDEDTDNPDALAFTGAVGTTSLAAVTVGNAANAGEATFAGVLNATAVTITGAESATETSSITVTGTSTITTLTLTGGGAADADATALFEATGASHPVDDGHYTRARFELSESV